MAYVTVHLESTEKDKKYKVWLDSSPNSSPGYSAKVVDGNPNGYATAYFSDAPDSNGWACATVEGSWQSAHTREYAASGGTVYISMR